MANYEINGVELTMQPTEGRWLPNTPLGVTGDGHPIYGAVRQYELRFNIETPAEFNQLMTDYNSVALTGTCVVALPEFGAATYVFKNYSGCTLGEPEMGRYFTEHHTEVFVLVSNIRT